MKLLCIILLLLMGHAHANGYQWACGTGAGSMHYWLHDDGPGSLRYWNKGDGPGSKYFWDHGDERTRGSRRFYLKSEEPGSLRYWLKKGKLDWDQASNYAWTPTDQSDIDGITVAMCASGEVIFSFCSLLTEENARGYACFLDFLNGSPEYPAVQFNLCPQL